MKLSKIVSTVRGDAVELRFYARAGKGRHHLHRRVRTTRQALPAIFSKPGGDPELLLPAPKVTPIQP